MKKLLIAVLSFSLLSPLYAEKYRHDEQENIHQEHGDIEYDGLTETAKGFAYLYGGASCGVCCIIWTPLSILVVPAWFAAHNGLGCYKLFQQAGRSFNNAFGNRNKPLYFDKSGFKSWLCTTCAFWFYVSAGADVLGAGLSMSSGNPIGSALAVPMIIGDFLCAVKLSELADHYENGTTVVS